MHYAEVHTMRFKGELASEYGISLYTRANTHVRAIFTCTQAP